MSRKLRGSSAEMCGPQAGALVHCPGKAVTAAKVAFPLRGSTLPGSSDCAAHRAAFTHIKNFYGMYRRVVAERWERRLTVKASLLPV